MVSGTEPDVLPRRRFTADEVLRMVELGLLDEGPNVELLEGELVIMNAQGPVHSSLTVRVRRLLERVYDEGYHVRDHSSVRATKYSLPEPDVAVVRGEPEDFEERLPGPKDIILIVEISDSSLRRDRRKADIYATAGFATYWLLDVDARRLEVRTKPQRDGVYANVEVLDERADVAVPGKKTKLRVSKLLPTRRRT